MADAIYRDTWAEINLDAIAYNVEQIKQKLPQHSNVMAVVKADAYGHGGVEVARKALEAGASMLAVALLEEALVLRNANIKAPILVFGRVSPKDTPLAAEHDITLTFFQKDWLREVKDFPLSHPLKLHMKWDTGMGRVGIRTTDELKEIVDELQGEQRINLTGIYTHFATADEPDLSYFEVQQARFEQLLHVFNTIWKESIIIHVGNSAASIRFPENMYHYIRFGIAMYGLYPSEIVKRERNIDLKPAFSLNSRLIHAKKIASGESISYGATHIASKDEWIGTIPIGYADGWIRKLQGIDVLIDGKRMPIVGRICMDQTMIKMDGEYPVGTKVTLIGKQENEEIEIDEIAAHLETINYEIPCMITNRVPRCHKEK
ncbi:alanine racemase [Virgibacillus litoralis]|uniref:Alanine racemase n=1 Tax=Virgibacillus litoralis TaxID=578221 RepID=A0ABS4HI88_9BACI|nr:alanine racemase [Virgibacillus litoralis]